MTFNNVRLITFTDKKVINAIKGDGVYYAPICNSSVLKAIGGYTGIKCFRMPNTSTSKLMYTGEFFRTVAQANNVLIEDLEGMTMVELSVPESIVKDLGDCISVLIPFITKSSLVMTYSIGSRVTINPSGFPVTHLNFSHTDKLNFGYIPTLASGFQTLTVPECIEHISDITGTLPLVGFNKQEHISVSIANQYISRHRSKQRNLVLV